MADEDCFMREGIRNTHNAHIWSSENPDSTVSSKIQHKFGINIWERILGDHLLGQYLLPKILSGVKYFVFLQHVLRDLMLGIPATVRQKMWFILNGASAHLAIAVRNHINATYPGKCIKRFGSFALPPCYTDLNR